MALRTLRIEGDVAYIPLTKGYEAVIDISDVSLVEGCNWTAQIAPRTVYAGRSFREFPGGSPRTLLLHRVILNSIAGVGVDHLDGNGLNNRRVNLRPATQLENSRNRKLNTNNSSGFKGVTWHKHSKKWVARITLNWKLVGLGYYASREEAYAAYCKASLKLHGNFGRTD